MNSLYKKREYIWLVALIFIPHSFKQITGSSHFGEKLGCQINAFVMK